MLLATDDIQLALHGLNRIVAKEEQRGDRRQIDYFHELESEDIYSWKMRCLILRVLGVDPVQTILEIVM